MAKTVIGIFSNTNSAETAIDNLENVGYNPKDISIVVRDVKDKTALKDTGADIAAGTTSGAATGAIIGGLAGLLSTAIIPGLGAFFIGGPIATALGLTGTAAATTSGALTGAAAGGLLGALTAWGLSESEAKSYQEFVNKGGILVAVPARDDEDDDVVDILKDEGADHIKSFTLEESDEKGFYEYSSSFTPSPAYAYTKGGKSERTKVKAGKRAKVNNIGSTRTAAGSKDTV